MQICKEKVRKTSKIKDLRTIFGLTLQKRYRLKTRLFTDFFEKMNIIFTSSDLCSDGFLGFILAYKKDIISFPCYGI